MNNNCSIYLLAATKPHGTYMPLIQPQEAMTPTIITVNICSEGLVTYNPCQRFLGHPAKTRAKLEIYGNWRLVYVCCSVYVTWSLPSPPRPKQCWKRLQRFWVWRALQINIAWGMVGGCANLWGFCSKTFGENCRYPHVKNVPTSKVSFNVTSSRTFDGNIEKLTSLVLGPGR